MEQGRVVMTLGGKAYTFMWGTRAIREMQEALSTPDHLVSPDEIFREIRRNRIKYVSTFIWAGLLKHHPETTPDGADDILDSASPEEVEKLIREFGLGLTPDPDDVKELSKGAKANPRKARPARRGTGSTSTSKPAVSV